MIQLDGSPILVNESCLEVPSVDGIPEEREGEVQDADAPSSPEIVHQDPVKVNATTSKEKKKAPPPPVQPENSPSPALTNGSVLKGGESVTILSVAPEVQTKISEDVTQEAEREKKFLEIESSLQDSENTASAIESAIREIENAVQEEDSEPGVEVAAVSQETAAEVSPSSQEVSSVPSSKEKESLKTVQEEALAPAALTQEDTSPSSEAVSPLPSTQMEAVAVTPIAQEVIPTLIPTALDTELLVPALTPTEIPAATTTALETEKVPVPAPMPEESESTESTSNVQRANPQPTVDLNSLPPPPPHATSEAVEKAAPSTEEPEAAEVIPEAGGEGVTVAQEGAAAQKEDSVTG